MMVDSRSGGMTPTLNEVKDEIDKRISIKQRHSNIQGWLNRLRQKANVRIC